MPTSATAAPGRLARRALPHLALLGLALGIALVNGGAGSTAEAATLEGAPWRLETYTGPDGQTRRALPGSEITATFQAGRMSGSAGCNSYSAGFALAQDTAGVIRISPAASTQRFCSDPPGVMDQEAAFLRALERVGRYTLAEDVLTLRDAAGGALLVFRPQPQTPLEGTLWAAENYNNGRGGLQSLAAGTEITARFEGGRLSGSAGCNSYSAGFALGGGGGAIVVSPPASTRMFCASPPGVMEQEAAYLAALPTAVRYRIEGERLSLETADGARVATYVARGAPGPADGVPRAAPPVVPGLPRTGAGPGEDPSAPADDLEE